MNKSTIEPNIKKTEPKINHPIPNPCLRNHNSTLTKIPVQAVTLTSERNLFFSHNIKTERCLQYEDRGIFRCYCEG